MLVMNDLIINQGLNHLSCMGEWRICVDCRLLWWIEKSTCVFITMSEISAYLTYDGEVQLAVLTVH